MAGHRAEVLVPARGAGVERDGARALPTAHGIADHVRLGAGNRRAGVRTEGEGRLRREVRLTLAAQDGDAVLSVADDGPDAS